MYIFGVHINDDPNKIINELDRVKNMGANLVQLFIEPLSIDNTIYDKFKIKLKKLNMFCVVHASYTINIAKEWDEYSLQVKQFIYEIEMAHHVGAFGIIIHIGKEWI